MKLTAYLGALLTFLSGEARHPHQPLPDRNPVLLVHGIADDAGNMERMAAYLRKRGWEVHTFSYTPNWAESGIAPLAGQLDAFARDTFGARRFDIVGFSLGGIVSRYYLQRLGGLKRVDHFVTLASPHHGTKTAHLLPNAGCRELRPGSAFLEDLARDAEELRRVKFTSLYTPFDLVIIPPESSVMPEARNVKLRIGTHPGMILSKKSLRAVSEALRS